MTCNYKATVNHTSFAFHLPKTKYTIIICLSTETERIGDILKEGTVISGILREVNIKKDMPVVNDAIKMVTYNIMNAGVFGVTAIKFIHGYGSTGKGGAIRIEMRAYLDRQKQKRVIKDFIPGEEFSIFSESTRNAFAVCDELRRDSDLEKHNNGITIVVL